MERALLIKKYNQPGPRYTSYPTVPYWQEKQMTENKWSEHISHAFWKSHKEISLYIHLPFCESLCTYCGCNTRITKNHAVEEVYINAVLKEWEMYLSRLPMKPILKELHLGGGTPTFFAPENLKKLLCTIQNHCEIPIDANYSFEGHPGNTTYEHLQTLFDLGFRRVSFGIQDFDPEIQKVINRIQTEEDIERVTLNAREIGYESVNYDLVYGLPSQTIESLKYTIKKTLEYRPSRIAFYSYAHIPWIKPAQKSFEHLLPTPDQKLNMYQFGKEELLAAGYVDIGMDHFAIQEDELTSASKDGSLHRNFMGYTTQNTSLSIGLGVSSVSDTWTAFSQNAKDLKTYYLNIKHNLLPLTKGHLLNEQDLIVRKHILNLMCRYETNWTEREFHLFGLNVNFDLLDELEADGIITFSDEGIKVTQKGRPFVRNVCMAIDARLNEKLLEEVMFSKTV
ncbi:MAG: oxygen-independent coproporphyrinogen III oxidase [bacterium]|nr:oxygen-independent coproporphyrinogen III oxidase [bacterium]